jgi:DNA-binding NarL/FixJ family response regulator
MAHLTTHVQATLDGDADLARAALVELAKAGRWAPLGRSAPTLTPREREVAGLVAAGLSSPDIARRLHLSSRTVETHVSRVMTKLGVGRRNEVAAALLTQ